jgi:hypothetical protein
VFPNKGGKHKKEETYTSPQVEFFPAINVFFIILFDQLGNGSVQELETAVLANPRSYQLAHCSLVNPTTTTTITTSTTKIAVQTSMAR